MAGMSCTHLFIYRLSISCDVDQGFGGSKYSSLGKRITLLLGTSLNRISSSHLRTELKLSNALAIRTLCGAARAKRSVRPPPSRRRKLAATKRKKPANPDADPNQGTYHSVRYIPFRGEVWELGGLESGPVGVGGLLSPPSPPGSGAAVRRSWMDVVQFALRVEVRKYDGGSDGLGVYHQD